MGNCISDIRCATARSPGLFYDALLWPIGNFVFKCICVFETQAYLVVVGVKKKLSFIFYFNSFPLN